MRLVLDTNAAVSGLLWHGNPGKLIDAAQAGSLILCASAPLLAELHGVLGREKFAKHLQVRGLTATQITSSMRLPIHMLATSPQKSAGSFAMTPGPG